MRNGTRLMLVGQASVWSTSANIYILSQFAAMRGFYVLATCWIFVFVGIFCALCALAPWERGE